MLQQQHDRLQQRTAEHQQLQAQMRDRRRKLKHNVQRLHKIRKELANVEEDNQELQLLLNRLLQAKMQSAGARGRAQ